MITKQFIEAALQKYRTLSPIYYNIEYQCEESEIWETAVRLTDRTIGQDENHFVETIHKLQNDQTIEYVKIQFYPSRKGYLDVVATLSNFEEPKNNIQTPPTETNQMFVPTFPPSQTTMPTKGLGLGEIRDALMMEFELKEAKKTNEQLLKNIEAYKKEMNELIDENDKYDKEIESLEHKIIELENAQGDKTKEMIAGLLGKVGEKLFAGQEGSSALQGLPEDNSPRSQKIREINQVLQYFDENALQQFHHQLQNIIQQQEPQSV